MRRQQFFGLEAIVPDPSNRDHDAAERCKRRIFDIVVPNTDELGVNVKHVMADHRLYQLRQVDQVVTNYTARD